jgi:hypothetical protein
VLLALCFVYVFALYCLFRSLPEDRCCFAAAGETQAYGWCFPLAGVPPAAPCCVCSQKIAAVAACSQQAGGSLMFGLRLAPLVACMSSSVCLIINIFAQSCFGIVSGGCPRARVSVRVCLSLLRRCVAANDQSAIVTINTYLQISRRKRYCEVQDNHSAVLVL